MRNVLDQTPPSCREEVHTWLRRILYADAPQAARQALAEAQDALDGQAGRALEYLTEGFEAATAVLALPAKYRKRLRTTNMLERFIGDASSPEEIRRREKVVRIFPNEQSAWRLVGALAAEQHETWSTGRRYPWRCAIATMDAYEQWKASCAPPEPQPAVA
jgi:transposase-like protein